MNSATVNRALNLVEQQLRVARHRVFLDRTQAIAKGTETGVKNNAQILAAWQGTFDLLAKRLAEAYEEESLALNAPHGESK